MIVDALVVGAGPAGLALTAALAQHGLRVGGLTPRDPASRWSNTYGIWCDELEDGLVDRVLGHCWTDCVVYTGETELALNRNYGLFDNIRLQTHLLTQCERGGVIWHQGMAAQVEHLADRSRLTTRQGAVLEARVVIDASGHRPALVQRPAATDVAYQAAYGIVGTFSRPPVRARQLVLMDYRADHLTPEERAGPPTFLYAMDLGDGQYFVEETSLAHVPAVSFTVLEHRLRQRLAAQAIEVQDVQHVEHCLFPMNLPLPDLDQPVLGFGSAASMVRPASGYQVGAALKRAPVVAQALAHALGSARRSPGEIARAGWRALWPDQQVRKHLLYLFGLASLLRFDQPRTQAFFTTFFQLPRQQWAGYLSDTLSQRELLHTMVRVFRQAPNSVRTTLMQTAGGERTLLWRALIG